MSHQTLVERFRGARSDPSLALLEGFHPIKHAIRFGAELMEVVCLNVAELARLTANHAPDIAGALDGQVTEVSADVFEELAPLAPPTGVIAIARRPTVSLTELLNNPALSPVVLLERPRNLGNIGAAVRVAAAAGAAGVLTIGTQDPWHPAALIGGAGLQFALPVTRTAALPVCDRPLVVIDPGGDPLPECSIPARAILAFGAERAGLSSQLMATAERRVSIPMSAGVSSLNLATAVAVVLYSGRFGQ
ncbi:MAG: rRNA methyltransferase [Chloroflexi bacterium]|nr:rRNA methyltransferase [Chloroflexota bacterium]